jgi:hypothetical protein
MMTPILGAQMSLDATHNSHAGRPRNGRVKNCQRSKVANGTALLPGVDGRSTWVRRCKELIADHVADLGGEDNTSAAERSLVRRASVLTVELERMEAKFATAGEASPEEIDLYARASSNLRRLLESVHSVGLPRRSRDAGTLDNDDVLDVYRRELNGNAP